MLTNIRPSIKARIPELGEMDQHLGPDGDLGAQVPGVKSLHRVHLPGIFMRAGRKLQENFPGKFQETQVCLLIKGLNIFYCIFECSYIK